MGSLPLVLGQPGGQLIKGFNAPNRVVLTKNAQPGQKIQLAVFGINGPLSNPPGNFIWVRSATLGFLQTEPDRPDQYVKHRNRQSRSGAGSDRFTRTPGSKSLLVAFFSLKDRSGFRPPPMHRGISSSAIPTPIRSIVGHHEGQVSVFRTKSGYSGFNIGEYHQPGSNGLTLDKQGPAHNQSTWQPAHHSRRTARQHYRAGRSL